jgi:hypothetical protein
MIKFVLFLLLTQCGVFFLKAKAGPQVSQIQQNQSVVDAARRSRERKKNAASPARVITNDDLESQHAKRSREGFNAGVPTVPRTDSPNADALIVHNAPNPGVLLTNDESGPDSLESEEAAAEDAEIARLKALLDSAESALHWQQRQFLLLQDTVYSNAAYTTTHAGKADLESAELQMEETQEEIDRLKEPLANLEWRQWRRMQAARSENDYATEEYKSPPPSALVLPQP